MPRASCWLIRSAFLYLVLGGQPTEVELDPDAPLRETCYHNKIFVRTDDRMEEVSLLLEKDPSSLFREWIKYLLRKYFFCFDLLVFLKLLGYLILQMHIPFDIRQIMNTGELIALKKDISGLAEEDKKEAVLMRWDVIAVAFAIIIAVSLFLMAYSHKKK